MEQQCEELRYKEVSALLASDAHASTYFGASVAIYGTRLVVGAQYDDTAGVKAGKIHIYDWNGGAYVEVAQLTASDAQDYDQFGVSVAISSNRLVVGARGTDVVGVDATVVDTGKVYIYDWNGAAYVEVAQLTASDAQAYDYFGVSVALSGNRLVVGAYAEDTAAPDAGKVYIYDWNGTVYDEVAQITASDAHAHDYFGASVAIYGNRLAVGAYGEDTTAIDGGKVYVYTWNGSAYVEVTTITAADAQAYDYFGISVALSSIGNRLVVGACGEDTAGVAAGKVYVYDWNSDTSVYDEVTSIIASDARNSGQFGVSVALSGNRLVVGSCGECDGCLRAGKVYIIDRQDNTEQQ